MLPQLGSPRASYSKTRGNCKRKKQSLRIFHMITILADNCNEISQKEYDRIIPGIHIEMLQCPACDAIGFMNYHGQYRRGIYADLDLIQLKITRVKCTACGRTHALMVPFIVPYSRISSKDQKDIIQGYEAGSSSVALADLYMPDDRNIRHILRRYRDFWKITKALP